MNLHTVTTAKTARMIGFGAFSLITGLYGAGLCTAALLQVMGAVSLARLASSTIFIVGVAAASLSWVLWRVYRMQRDCDDSNCLSTRSTWLISIFAVAAFVVDVII
jgi:high-affinity Fe2+/Pb2+ permease